MGSTSFYLSATTTTKHLIQNMKYLILSLVIFLNLFSNIRSILQCFVKENSSNEQKNCIFPFTLDTDPDFAYNECTKIYDNSGKYWCSTKVDEDTGLHQKGHWGYCEGIEAKGSCPIPDKTVQLSQSINYVMSTVESTDAENCPCKKILECDWAKHIFQMLSNFSATDPLRVKAVALMRNKVCKNAIRKIKCCDLSTRPVNETIDEEDENRRGISGKWIPSPKNGECGARLTSEQVIGGDDSKLGEFPYMALLGYALDGIIYYLCGGSVLNSRHVLTAAHCHNDERPIRRVVVGEHTLNTSPDCRKSGDFCLPKNETLAIDKVIKHPRWNRAEFYNGYDIALVRVKGHISLFGMSNDIESYVSPICLPWNSNDPGYSTTAGQVLTATGWGTTTNKRTIVNKNYDDLRAATGILQRVSLKAINKTSCQEYYTSANYSLQVCAGDEKGKDTCKGDSGGPLVTRTISGTYYQAGIVSYGSKNCASGVPAIYTRVSGFVDWIIDNLEP